MANISTKVDLLKLAGAIKHKNKDGVDWLMIPIDHANLYNCEKGVYLDLTSIPLKQQKDNSKDTHLVKQSISKEKFAAMTDEEKNAMPILGNTIQWPDNGNNIAPAATPKPASGNTPSWM